jgi:hypothetical protein
MQEEWPEYIDDAAEVATSPPRDDRADRWHQLSLTAALEHLAQRREQVRALRRRAALLTALAILEGGILLGLLLHYFSG